MRIGIDGGCLANRRGFGRYARQVLEALAAESGGHELVVILDRPSVGAVKIPAGVEIVVAEVAQAPSAAATATGRRRLKDMLAMGRAADRARLDLLFFPASYSFFPVWGFPRVVVAMHDTLALERPELVLPTRSGRWAWWLKETVAARRADCVVTLSEASRRDLMSWFRLPRERVYVSTAGPAPAFRPQPPGRASDAILERIGLLPGERFLLYVGGLSPHKNLPRLIEAFARTVPTHTRLVLVGDLGDVFHTHVPVLREAITRHGLGHRVLLPGFVPDADLAHVYSRAYALVQPSLMEGFGFPPVEAMACGTPVLYSRAGSLPEVVGDAGWSFDPVDTADIAWTLQRLLNSPTERDRLAAVALDRSSLFTWKAAARSLLDCFESLDPRAVVGAEHFDQGPIPVTSRRPAGRSAS